MTRQMTGAQIVIQALRDQGVDTVFGYPGGAVLPIYDEIFQQNDIRHVLVRHEQGAAHAAEGYARSTGRPGVVLVTSGPGATNAVTGMTDALMDSIPMVVLTGQVPTFMIGNDAFQEADTVGITRPCTKHNWLVKDTAKLAETIHQAFHVAMRGRPGPVLVDIPKDVQFATAAYTPPEKARVHHYQPQTKGDPDAVLAAVEALERAERPILYSGGGVINSGPEASRLLRELAEATGLPAHLDADGARRLPGERRRAGSACSACTAPSRPTGRCTTATSCSASAPASTTASPAGSTPSRPHSFKVHIDIDPSSINKNIHVDVPIVGDVGNVLADMLALWQERGLATRVRGGGEVVAADRALARAQLPRLPQLRQGDQAAVRAAAARGADQGPRPLHLHRGRPAPDVGGAVHGLRGAEPLDDERRPRHHGLRPARPRSGCRSPTPTRWSSTSPARRAG